jgi:hypothetical protein
VIHLSCGLNRFTDFAPPLDVIALVLTLCVRLHHSGARPLSPVSDSLSVVIVSFSLCCEMLQGEAGKSLESPDQRLEVS